MTIDADRWGSFKARWLFLRAIQNAVNFTMQCVRPYVRTLRKVTENMRPNIEASVWHTYTYTYEVRLPIFSQFVNNRDLLFQSNFRNCIFASVDNWSATTEHQLGSVRMSTRDVWQSIFRQIVIFLTLIFKVKPFKFHRFCYCFKTAAFKSVFFKEHTCILAMDILPLHSSQIVHVLDDHFKVKLLEFHRFASTQNGFTQKHQFWHTSARA